MFPLAALLEVGAKIIDKLSLQGLFRCFSRTQPEIDCVVGQTGFFAPLRYAKSSSKGADKSCVSSVFGLLCSSGPRAIFWAVTFFIVNSFNAKSTGPLAHIGQKIGKLQPASTNCDSSAPVVFIRLTCRTGASFFKTLPYVVCRRVFSAQRVSV